MGPNDIDHLIILPCHSIWTPQDEQSIGETRKEWSLVSFQIEGYDHLCFKNHIEKSIEILDDKSQLIISGGQTKFENGPISESQSYYQLAMRLYPELRNNKNINITTEEFARDSFENVIFLISRFYEIYEYYPTRISIVGFEFKRERFLNHHFVQGLQWKNISDINYIGNSPTPIDLNEEKKEEYFKDLSISEDKFAVQLFKNDWFGSRGKLLAKKSDRNPFKRFHGYEISNPEIAPFLKCISDDGDKLLSNEEIIEKLNGVVWTL